jgi:hypothetical protein
VRKFAHIECAVRVYVTGRKHNQRFCCLGSRANTRAQQACRQARLIEVNRTRHRQGQNCSQAAVVLSPGQRCSPGKCVAGDEGSASRALRVWATGPQVREGDRKNPRAVTAQLAGSQVGQLGGDCAWGSKAD